MLETFGTRLRRRREEQAIALATIAEETKIKVSLLEALERDDLSHWPSGIFRRAFVRSYALAIRLDPNDTVREFLSEYPDPAEVVEAAAPQAPDTSDPPTRTRRLLAALGSLAGVGRHAEPPPPPPPDDPRLPALAQLCMDLGRAVSVDKLGKCLDEAARILDATGLIVWVWDAAVRALKPAAAQGYSRKVLAQLPPVGRDSDNATAAAFRSAQPQSVHAGDGTRGALVVPMMTPYGCVGVLAVEVRHGSEDANVTRGSATIVAALLAQVVARSH
jgi:transcriptional regulator with XRE-family HTH domain